MNPPSAARALDLLIVGAGFGGLYMLHKARRMGLHALVLEASPSVGGTWYHNRYPGARVDIQSLEYSYSFDEALQQEWRWTERYAAQPELLRYANHVADRFGLRDGIRFSTRMIGAHFDEAAREWVVRSDLGEAWRARFLVMASGPLSSPNKPDFAGLRDFEGPVLHTADWPHEPVDFSGQRVAVVGTGSSAVQAIPIIARQARELTVFQRTAAYAAPARNGPLNAELEARVKADYAGFRARNRRMHGGFGSLLPPNPVPALSVSAAQRQEAFEQRWQVGGFALLGAFNDLLIDLKANETAAQFVREKIRATVTDPATAQLLSPSHTLGCKRLCVDSGYYETFNRPNVRLVDISQAPIERFNRKGLRGAGRDFEFDALVLATGFDAMTGTMMRLDLRGRGGLRIQDKWHAGPLNYLGLGIAGFPNLFNIAGPGSTSAFTNVIVAIEHHVDWIAECIAHLDARGLRSIEASEQAEAGWTEHVNASARRTVFLSCNSWYLGANIPGKPRMFMPLADGFPRYADQCTQVAAKGYEGFVLQ
jgi:cyclohexanone monooxygenase